MAKKSGTFQEALEPRMQHTYKTRRSSKWNMTPTDIRYDVYCVYAGDVWSLRVTTLL